MSIKEICASRLLFTYLLPLIPLAATFDGIVSCLRTDTPKEMEAMAAGLGGDGYQWQAGEERVKGRPGVITYLLGYPSAPRSEPSSQAEEQNVAIPETRP